MAFNATYTEDDVAPIVVDTASTILVKIGSVAAIIGFLFAVAIGVFLVRWMSKKKR